MNLALLREGICKKKICLAEEHKVFQTCWLANLRADIIHHDNRANRTGFTEPFTQGEETEPDSAWKNAQEIPAVEKDPTP